MVEAEGVCSLARSIGNKLKYATIKSLNCVFVLLSLPAREAANSALKDSAASRPVCV